MSDNQKNRCKKKTQKKKDAKRKKGGMMSFFHESRHEAEARIMRPAYKMPV